jgi:superfamily II DNA/RNA helicase
MSTHLKEQLFFKDIGVQPWLLRALQTVNILYPTEIQQHTIPEILKGSSVIATAKTGSGKTLAFGLPILQRLSEEPYGIFAVILTPTHELAFQIAEQFQIIGKGVNLKDAVIVGGLGKIGMKSSSLLSLILKLVLSRYDETGTGTIQKTTCSHCNTRTISRSY